MPFLIAQVGKILRSQVIFLYYHGYFMNLQSQDKRDRTLLMRSTRNFTSQPHDPPRENPEHLNF